MNGLNKYFKKVRKLKLDKPLIDDTILNSIVQKKHFIQNLKYGATIMSAITILILTFSFFMAQDTSNQNIDLLSKKKLPVFHLTIQEFEELGIIYFPKTYNEYKKDDIDKLFRLKNEKESSILLLSYNLEYKYSGSFGSSVGGFHITKIMDIERIKMEYFFRYDLINFTEFKKKENFKFIKNDYLIVDESQFASFHNLVCLSLKNKPDYISDFIIYALPNEALYEKLPNRFKEILKNNFTFTDDLLIDNNAIVKYKEKVKLDTENEVEIKLSGLELSNKELSKIGININKLEIDFIVASYYKKENITKYGRYLVGSDGNVKDIIKIDSADSDIFPLAFDTYKNIKTPNKLVEAGSQSYFFSNKYKNLPLYEIKKKTNSNNEKITLSYDKRKLNDIDNILNTIIPIKFSIENDEIKNDFIFWYQITDNFIDNLPERYKKRFRKEVELYTQVLNDEKELKDLCHELEEESLLGLCLNEFINKINIYPNPTNSTLKFDLELENDKNIDLKILDVSGKELLSDKKSLKKGPNYIELDVSNINPGIYIINVYDKNKLIFNRNIVID